MSIQNIRLKQNILAIVLSSWEQSIPIQHFSENLANAFPNKLKPLLVYFLFCIQK